MLLFEFPTINGEDNWDGVAPSIFVFLCYDNDGHTSIAVVVCMLILGLYSIDVAGIV